MIKIQVKDFQSIKDSTIVIDGFTALTGPNNSGKSALVRAVRSLFNNSPASVKMGALYCEVIISFDDGNKVTWRKGKGYNSYEINGKLLENVGKNVPEEVLALGVGKIKVGSHTLWPQIASQNVGQVFLLDKTGATVAEAVADVERVGTLNKALSLVEKERRSFSSELKIRSADLKSVEEKIESFEGVYSLEEKLDFLSNLEKESLSLRSKHSDISRLRDEWEMLSQLLLDMEKVSLIDLMDLERVTKLKSIFKALEYYSEILKELDNVKDTLDLLSKIQELNLPDLSKINSLRSNLEELNSLRRKIDVNSDLLHSLSGIPEDPSVKFVELRELHSKFTILQGWDKDLKDSLLEIEEYEKVPSLDPEESLLNLREGFHNLSEASELFSLLTEVDNTLTSLGEKEDHVLSSLVATDEEFHNLLEEMGGCPLCGARSQDGNSRLAY